jgi:hypothetical protein
MAIAPPPPKAIITLTRWSHRSTCSYRVILTFPDATFLMTFVVDVGDICRSSMSSPCEPGEPDLGSIKLISLGRN